MSNHYSAANLKFPGDDARLDMTDLFVFASPEDPGTTVLIIDFNPYTTGMSAMPPFLMKSEFHPDGIYRFNIDRDADGQADAAFTFVFSELKDGKQTGTAYYATGDEARRPEPAGEVLIRDTPVGFDASARPVQAGPVRRSTAAAIRRSTRSSTRTTSRTSTTSGSQPTTWPTTWTYGPSSWKATVTRPRKRGRQP